MAYAIPFRRMSTGTFNQDVQNLPESARLMFSYDAPTGYHYWLNYLNLPFGTDQDMRRMFDRVHSDWLAYTTEGGADRSGLQFIDYLTGVDPNWLRASVPRSMRSTHPNRFNQPVRVIQF